MNGTSLGPRPFRAGPLVRSVYAPSLLHAVGAGMLGPAIPLFAQDLDVSLGLIGMLASVQGMGAVAIDVPAGLLVARVGGRRAMLLGVAMSGLGALALALAQTPAHLFMAVPLLGAGFATWATSRLAYLAGVVPVDQRGRALALVGGVARIGLALGPIAGGLLGERFGIQAAFLGHAAAAACAFALMTTQRNERHVRPSPSTDRAHVRVLRTLTENRGAFATAGTVAISLVMLRSVRGILIPLWGASLGLDLGEIGLVIGLASAVDMTLFYPVGMVMDRFGRKWTIVPCLVLLATSLAAIPFTTGFSSFLVAALLGGLGNGLGSGAVQTMGADLAPPEHSGEFLGVWRLITDSGGVAAPALAGLLAQLLTLGAAFLGAASFGVAGALVMALWVPEALHRYRLDAGR